MENAENINVRYERVRDLLCAYLQSGARPNSAVEPHAHLDEDALTAFNEGNLTRREADPLVAHLSNCSFCRHKTADLIRLDLALSDVDAAPQRIAGSEPAKTSEVIAGILERLFGVSESAVFAHDEKRDEDAEHLPIDTHEESD